MLSLFLYRAWGCVLSSLIYMHLKQPMIFLLAPSKRCVPRPVSVPKGRVSAPGFRLTGSQTLRQQLLKECNVYSPVGLQVWAPLATRARLSGGVPWAAVAKTGAPDKCISSFLGDASEPEKGRGSMPKWSTAHVQFILFCFNSGHPLLKWYLIMA